MSFTDRHAARAIILTDANEILLMRMAFPWHEQDLWILPGGGIEPGETAEQAVVREIHEETGADGLKLVGQLWHREFVVEATATRMLQQYFLVRAERFQPVATALLGDEADWLQEYRWWTLAELGRAAAHLNLEPLNLATGVERYLAEGLPAVAYDIDRLL